jgi:hypothetical protein
VTAERHGRDPLESGARNDPADDDRDVGAGFGQLAEHRRDQLGVRAGEDREADHVDPLLRPTALSWVRETTVCWVFANRAIARSVGGS